MICFIFDDGISPLYNVNMTIEEFQSIELKRAEAKLKKAEEKLHRAKDRLEKAKHKLSEAEIQSEVTPEEARKALSTRKRIRNMLITNKFLCGACIVASIVLSMILLSIGHRQGFDVVNGTFSSIGTANHLLFIFWGIATGLAVYLNLSLLALRLGIINTWFYVALVIGCIGSLITVSFVGWDPTIRAIHIVSAAVFGLFSTLCLLYILIVKMKQKGKRTSLPYLTAIIIVGVIFIFTSVQVGWFTALTQVLLSNICLVAMFCSNFFESWSKEMATKES